MRDARVADAPFRLPRADRRELRVEVEEVVHLKKVDLPEHAERAPHLLEARAFPPRPDLRRDEERGEELRLGGEGAKDTFGAAVHRRGVHDASAPGREPREDLGEGPPGLGPRADVERLPRPEADRGQPLPGRGDRARQERGRPARLAARPRRHEEPGRASPEEPQRVAPRDGSVHGVDLSGGRL